jgi:hypothetical protein
MKKLFVIILFAGFCAGASSQFIQKPTKPETYALTANDTMRIHKSDGIAGVTIIVPAGATDSVWAKGSTGTLDGHTSGYIKIPPNGVLGFGYNDQIRIDSLTIVVKNKANVVVTPYKR